MSLLRSIAVRRLNAVIPKPSRPVIQKRYARVVDVRFYTTPATSIEEKYRKKLEEKAKAEGLASLDDLKEAYKDKIEEVRREANSIPIIPKGPKESGVIAEKSTVEPKSPAEAPSEAPPKVANDSASKTFTSKYPPPPPGLKVLSSYIDPAKLALHDDPKEIEFLWRARFVNDEHSLCATIQSDTYKRIDTLSGIHEMFILPLPREGKGTDFHLLQWMRPHPGVLTCLITSLAEYQLHKEFAVPHTILSHFEDLLEDKGLVMMHGVVTPDKGVSVDEAKLLAFILQKFYAARNDEVGKRRIKYLQSFTDADPDFDFHGLMAEAEKLE